MSIAVAAQPTVLHHFVGHVRTRADRQCLWYHTPGQPVDVEEKAVTIRTWRDIARDTAHVAAALRALGVERGDRVVFISPNRAEWIPVDLAVLALGAVHVPVHNSLAGPQMQFQIVDCGAKLVIVAGEEQAAKIAATSLPAGTGLASLDAVASAPAGTSPRRLFEVVPPPTEAELDAFLDSAGVGTATNDLATILYTSGTTGEPKGVMLSHGNITSNAEGIVAGFGGAQDERRLNLLPFSHIFARTCDLYVWLIAGSEMALADAPQTAVENCAEFQPRILNAVPYFYERVMRKVVEMGVADMPDILRLAMGGAIEHCCSGGAALPDHIAKFFNDRGVLLTQGYGLTETSPVITMNTHLVYKHGTVGRPLENIEVRIADDGEIVTRGPHVMLGYWNRPEETAAAVVDGWFHTGDVGEIDGDGYLKITGRKKEIIVTTGGKKVAPLLLEAKLTSDPLIRQAAIVGEGKDYLAALIVPNFEGLAEALRETIGERPQAELVEQPEARELIGRAIRERLADLSHYEQVQRFTLVGREFDVDHGEMTLTMKLRRKRVAENFRAEIEEMYRK